MANIYIPPPYSPEILKGLVFISDKSDSLCIVIGDFNNYMDASMDKFSSLDKQYPQGTTAFAKYLAEMGLFDLLEIAKANK